MQGRFLVPVILTMLLASCHPGPLNQVTPSETQTAAPHESLTPCAVTQPQTPAFHAPLPYSFKSPFEGEFWYGSIHSGHRSQTPTVGRRFLKLQKVILKRYFYGEKDIQLKRNPSQRYPSRASGWIHLHLRSLRPEEQMPSALI